MYERETERKQEEGKGEAVWRDAGGSQREREDSLTMLTRRRDEKGTRRKGNTEHQSHSTSAVVCGSRVVT